MGIARLGSQGHAVNAKLSASVATVVDVTMATAQACNGQEGGAYLAADAGVRLTEA